MPATTFHWIRVQTFCYATERKELLEEVMEELLGDAEYSEELTESEHGNTMIILEARLTKQKQFKQLFERLGADIREWIVSDMENRIDEDCVFYMRLDKQKAVMGEYAVAHHGDVISITGKVQSHPARKEIAARALEGFLAGISDQSSSEDSS